MKPDQLRLLVRVSVFIMIAVLGRMVFPALLQPFGDALVVAALSSFAAGAVANAVLTRGWESGKPAEFGLAWSRDSAREMVAGIAGGAGGATLIVGFSVAARMAVWEPAPATQHPWAGIPVLATVLLLGAVGEELLFHGYGFQQLVRGVGEFATVLPVGILFGLAHLGNQGVTMLAILNTIAWGVLLGCAYLRTRALWLPIGLHFGWNVAMPLLGVNLSGFTMGVTGYGLRWRTDDLWSGGAYGLEGGLFTTLVVIGLFFLLYRVLPERGSVMRGLALVLVLSISAAGLRADSKKLTDDQRIELLRGLTAEYAKIRVLLPRSKEILEFTSDGVWDKSKWVAFSRELGVAGRVGDLIQVTHIAIDKDRIIFELNGGNHADRKKWYDHIQAGMGNGAPISAGGATNAPAGVTIALTFGGPIGEVTSADIKKLLQPVLDFEKESVTENYVDTLPEPIKEAVKAKKAIEGMNRDQVILAVGRPIRKDRETKNGTDYEDWIYGEPPGRVTFVTFTGDKVVKVKETYAGLGGSIASTSNP